MRGRKRDGMSALDTAPEPEPLMYVDAPMGPAATQPPGEPLAMTPGPWRVMRARPMNTRLCAEAGGVYEPLPAGDPCGEMLALVANCDSRGEWLGTCPPYGVVAVVPVSYDQADQQDWGTARAMAAAPEMLELLSEAADLLRGGRGTSPLLGRIQQVLNAVHAEAPAGSANLASEAISPLDVAS